MTGKFDIVWENGTPVLPTPLPSGEGTACLLYTNAEGQVGGGYTIIKTLENGHGIAEVNTAEETLTWMRKPGHPWTPLNDDETPWTGEEQPVIDV